MKPRNAGHRDKDERQKAREMADLKSENSQLRRKVARLQREIDRLEFLKVESSDDDEIMELTEQPPKRKQGSCQSCGEMTLKELGTPTGKIVLACTSCRSRQSK